MDRMHAEGLQKFLDNQTTPLTQGKGNQPLEPQVVDGVKVFNLTVDEIDWEVEPGKIVAARGYNGAVPGPILRATEGDRVRIVVQNNLTESTTVHWHGLYVPNNMDGVPYINQDPIKSGTSFTYEFTLRNSGTHMYHSHHNSLDQVNRGLLGAFIVDPKDPSEYPAYDREYIMVLNDLTLGFTINGKSFPATDAVVAKKGERVLIRYMNEGVMNHPMHLHGMPQTVIAKDGWPLTSPQKCDTVDVAPGQPLRRARRCDRGGYLGLPLPHPVTRRRPDGHVRPRNSDGGAGVAPVAGDCRKLPHHGGDHDGCKAGEVRHPVPRLPQGGAGTGGA